MNDQTVDLVAQERTQGERSAETLERMDNVYFPVACRPCVVDGVRVPGYVAVKRLDTGEVFGFRSEDYRLIPNEEVFPAFDAAVRESFDVTEMRTVDALAEGGARTVRRYQLPAHRKEIGAGDWVTFELKVINSYDGSIGLSVQSAATRSVCSNGMTVHDDVKLYARHTKGFEAAGLVERLRATLSLFETGAKQWLAWALRDVDGPTATAIFEAMPQTNPTRVETLERYWLEEQREQGRPSLWALYNAATRWATHAPVRAASRNAACIVLRRHQAVLAMTRSGPFTQALIS